MSAPRTYRVELAGALDVARLLSNIPSQILKAQQRALGTLRRRLLTEARRDIQAEYNLKASTIRQRLYISNRKDGIVLVGKATGVNLMQFGARQTRVGVSYSVNRGKRETRAHAFIRRTRNGNGPYVWLRDDKGDNQYTHMIAAKSDARFFGHGYPIYNQYGPSVAQMLKHGRRPERLAEFAIRILEAEQRRLLGEQIAMPKITLIKPHTHAGQPCAGGDVINVDTHTADWLTAHGVGKPSASETLKSADAAAGEPAAASARKFKPTTPPIADIDATGGDHEC